MPFAGKDLILGTAEVFDSLALAPVMRMFRRDGEWPLTAFLFHRFFEAEELHANPAVYPHEGVTTEIFEQFIAALVAEGVDFVLPQDLARKRLGRRPVMITVDDGYADNLRILPILRRYGAKATVFVSAAHVERQRRFWPDALFAGAAEAGWSRARAWAETRRLTDLPHDLLDAELEALFGPDIHKPLGPLDRPLLPEELAELAAAPEIEIGCHGYEHTTLAPRAEAFVARQVRLCGDYLESVVGYRPRAISYPNGRYSDALLRQCRAEGFAFGFTIEARPNALRYGRLVGDSLRLGRITFSGQRDTRRQLTSATLPRSAMRAVYGMKVSRVPSLPQPEPEVADAIYEDAPHRRQKLSDWV